MATRVMPYFSCISSGVYHSFRLPPTLSHPFFVAQVCAMMATIESGCVNTRTKKQLECVKKIKSLTVSDFMMVGYKWLWLFISRHLPTQNRENMDCNTSSVVTSPTISLKWKMHSRRSWEMKSPDNPVERPSCTRRIASRARVRAS